MSQKELEKESSSAAAGSDLSAQWHSLLPTRIERPAEDKVGSTHMYDVDPRVWGRHFWAVFHLLAYAYPEQPAAEVQQAIYQVFDAMRAVLPCSDCRQGFAEQWRKYDIRDHLDSRESLITWIVQVHDSVNEKLGMAELDYAEYMERLTGDKVVVVQSESMAEGDSDNEKEEEISKVETKSVDVTANDRPESGQRAKFLDSTQTGSKQSSANRTAFAAAINNGESPLAKMDARRSRARQSSAFAQARRLRDASSASRHHQPRVTHHTTTGSAWRTSSAGSTGVAQDYFSELFQSSRGTIGGGGGASGRNKSIGRRVKAPRECENCNRKILAPSVFS